MYRFFILLLVTPLVSLVLEDVAHAQDRNTTEEIRIPVNVSLVPGISVGDAVAGATGARIINQFSYNLLAGKSYALEGIEFGHIWNEYTGYVRGVQFAGVLNSVADSINGAQFAGIGNINGGHLRGAQFAGIANVTGETVYGVQSAGVANLAGSRVYGVQTAGVANIAGEGVSAQFSGVASVSGGNVDAVQVSGVASLAAGSVYGLQLSGVVNTAGGEVTGAQIGVVNVGQRVHGLQLGLVNVSRENSGVPIGLVSYVHAAGLRFDGWVDETGLISTAMRSGNRRIANYLGVGAVPGSTDFTWSTLAGVGYEQPLSDAYFGTFDLLTYGLRGDSWDSWSSLSKVRLMVGLKLSSTIALIGGPTFNVYVSDDLDGSELAPWSVYETRTGSTYVRMWPGFSAGVRIGTRAW